MLNGRGEKSAFDRGVSSVSMLLVRLMLVMAPAVFAINAATKGNVIDALLFATSVAVGITPQMLPVIVTTSLSQGAKDLARRQVIVKELPAIQNLGAMDVLCCDKTGTLTEDRIVLERYLNTDGNEDARVLRHAFLNSFFQTGLKNLIDLAVIDRADVTPSTVAPDSMLGQSPRDHAAPALCALTVLGLALVTWLPASPIADALGLMTLPASFFALLIGIVAAYIALTQLTKRRFIARHGELL